MLGGGAGDIGRGAVAHLVDVALAQRLADPLLELGKAETLLARVDEVGDRRADLGSHAGAVATPGHAGRRRLAGIGQCPPVVGPGVLGGAHDLGHRPVPVDLDQGLDRLADLGEAELVALGLQARGRDQLGGGVHGGDRFAAEQAGHRGEAPVLDAKAGRRHAALVEQNVAPVGLAGRVEGGTDTTWCSVELARLELHVLEPGRGRLDLVG